MSNKRAYHITDIYCAMRIINSRKFEPVSTNENNGDAGMNLFGLSDEYNKRQCFEKTGCEIHFESTESAIKVKIDTPIKELELDTLYDQAGWRMFVKYPLKKDLLKVISVKFTDDEKLREYVINDYIENNFLRKILFFLKLKSLEFYVYKFKSELQAQIESEDIYIHM